MAGRNTVDTIISIYRGKVTKLCRKCGQEKPTIEFRKRKAAGDGLAYCCKSCVANMPSQQLEYKQAKYELNKTEINAGSRQYFQEHKAEIAAQKRLRRQIDVQYKLSWYLRNRLYKALKRKSNISAVRHAGCSLADLVSHIERQFQPGMTWSNYGPLWHIDHVKPLAKFDLNDDEQVRQACHYTNLQPMWAQENESKGAKYHESN